MVAARSAASRRHGAAGALSPPRTPGSGAQPRDQTRAAQPARLRLLALRRRRSLALRLRRTAPRRSRRDRGPGPRAGNRAPGGAGAGPARGGDERQRARLSPLAGVSRGTRAPRRPSDPHSSLHAALERQGRALHPDPEERVGLRPLVAGLDRADQGIGILPSLLQPATTPQLAG